MLLASIEGQMYARLLLDLNRHAAQSSTNIEVHRIARHFFSRPNAATHAFGEGLELAAQLH
jgi:hypothetical protein